jgi:hypothetical protein
MASPICVGIKFINNLIQALEVCQDAASQEAYRRCSRTTPPV